MKTAIKTLIVIGCALCEVSANSAQLTIDSMRDALRDTYTPQAVHATGYIMGAYDAMEGIVHCPVGMAPARDVLLKWVREALERYKGPNKGADHLLASVFAQRAPCGHKGLT